MKIKKNNKCVDKQWLHKSWDKISIQSEMNYFPCNGIWNYSFIINGNVSYI